MTYRLGFTSSDVEVIKNNINLPARKLRNLLPIQRGLFYVERAQKEVKRHRYTLINHRMVATEEEKKAFNDVVRTTNGSYTITELQKQIPYRTKAALYQWLRLFQYYTDNEHNKVNYRYVDIKECTEDEALFLRTITAKANIMLKRVSSSDLNRMRHSW